MPPHVELWRVPPWAKFRRPPGGPDPRHDHPDCQDCWGALVICGACGRPVCPDHHPDYFRCHDPDPVTEG